MKKTLVFVPTYNERDNALRMARELSALGLDLDILFIDDNSPDGTGRLLEKLRTEIPQLYVQHRSCKQGVGSAHIEGISWAYEQGYTRIVTLDCDFTHSPSDVPRMLFASEDSDLAVGSRWIAPDSLPGWNIYRRFMTFAGHAMTKYVLGITQDATSAFRVYRLDRIPHELFELIHSKSYSFFFESMFVFKRNKLLINQVSIKLPARTYGSSKMSARTAWSSVLYIFKLAFDNIRRPERFLCSTAPVEKKSCLQDPHQNEN